VLFSKITTSSKRANASNLTVEALAEFKNCKTAYISSVFEL